MDVNGLNHFYQFPRSDNILYTGGAVPFLWDDTLNTENSILSKMVMYFYFALNMPLDISISDGVGQEWYVMVQYRFKNKADIYRFQLRTWVLT